MNVVPTYPTKLVAWKKLDSRAMLIILDGVKDHIIPHLFKNNTALKMWNAFEVLYQRKNENRKMVM